jgi:hypothetical protein
MRFHVATTNLRGAVLLAALTFGCSQASPDGIYQNGFPSEDTFFPLGAWLQSPDRAQKYKEMGINVFIGLWEGPTEAQLAALARYNMFAVAEQMTLGYAQ